jgi:hypothetical protein
MTANIGKLPYVQHRELIKLEISQSRCPHDKLLQLDPLLLGASSVGHYFIKTVESIWQQT